VGIVGHYLVTSLVLLITLRALLGAAEALYFVAGFAAIADLAPPGRAGEALSLNSLAVYAGLAAGPLIGQALLRWGGFHLAWAGAAALAAFATVAAAKVPETRPGADPATHPSADATADGSTAGSPAPPHASSALLHPSAITPGVALFSGVAAMSGFLAFAVLQAREVGIEAWSAVLLVFGVTVVALRMVFATLPDRVPPLRLAAAALAAAASGLLVIGAIGTPVGLITGAVVLAVATAFLTPAIFTAVFSTVPAQERGSAAATTSIFIDLGLGLGPMLTGLMAAMTTTPTAFLLASALPIAGASLLVAIWTRRTSPQPGT
jgi:predicted MFS family arabinose efflux permease